MTDATGRIRVYSAMSLDGCIAGTDHDLSWLDAAGASVPAEAPDGVVTFDGFMAEVGALLMGRTTYDVVCGFGEDAWMYGDRPVLVPTHRPLEPLRPSVRAVSGDIGALLDQAREAADGRDVYLDGGSLIRQAAALDAIDEYILTVVPTVLGQGVSLFSGLPARRELALVRHVRYGAMLQLTLERRA